jgi:hypothetical protein
VAVLRAGVGLGVADGVVEGITVLVGVGWGDAVVVGNGLWVAVEVAVGSGVKVGVVSPASLATRLSTSLGVGGKGGTTRRTQTPSAMAT